MGPQSRLISVIGESGPMSERDICGYEDTTTGRPCQNPPGCTIPSHNGIVADGGNPQGRPTKFNDERARAAIGAAREIGAIRSAARAAGVAHPTMLEWVDDEEKTYIDAEGDVCNFAEAFRQAQYDRELELRTADHGELEPSMAKFWLDRALGHRKTEKHELEHSGSGGGPLEIAVRREVVDVNDE